MKYLPVVVSSPPHCSFDAWIKIGFQNIEELSNDRCLEIMAKRSPPDPMYVFRGTGAAINVLKFAPKSTRKEGLLLSG